MRPGRLELPPRIRGTRPSTLRVYQFRHRRLLPRIIGPGGSVARDLTGVRRGRYSANIRSKPAIRRTRLVDLKLTKRQQEIFEFIKRYSARHGYPPTVRDIGKAIGLTSSSTVHAHLANLEKLGALRRDPTKPRAMEILDKAKKAIAPSGLP